MELNLKALKMFGSMRPTIKHEKFFFIVYYRDVKLLNTFKIKVYVYILYVCAYLLWLYKYTHTHVYIRENV